MLEFRVDVTSLLLETGGLMMRQGCQQPEVSQVLVFLERLHFLFWMNDRSETGKIFLLHFTPLCNEQKSLKGTAVFPQSFPGWAELYSLITQLPRNWVKPAPNFSAVDRLDLLRTLVKYSTRKPAPQQSHCSDGVVKGVEDEKPNLRTQRHLATVEKTFKQKSGWEIHNSLQFLLIEISGRRSCFPLLSTRFPAWLQLLASPRKESG